MSAPAAVSAPAVAAPGARDRRRPPLLPLVIVTALVLCALGAPLLAPHSPVEGSLGERLIPPVGMEGWQAGHVLGTDRHGRDVLSRLIHGARISLSVSVVGIVLTGTLGSLVGLVAGFHGGFIFRVADQELRPRALPVGEGHAHQAGARQRGRCARRRHRRFY